MYYSKAYFQQLKEGFPNVDSINFPPHKLELRSLGTDIKKKVRFCPSVKATLPSGLHHQHRSQVSGHRTLNLHFSDEDRLGLPPLAFNSSLHEVDDFDPRCQIITSLASSIMPFFSFCHWSRKNTVICISQDTVEGLTFQTMGLVIRKLLSVHDVTCMLAFPVPIFLPFPLSP